MPADRAALKHIANKKTADYNIIRMFWQRTEASTFSSACDASSFSLVWGELGHCLRNHCKAIKNVEYSEFSGTMRFKEQPVSIRTFQGVHPKMRNTLI